MPICRTREAAALITVLRRRATDAYDTAYDRSRRPGRAPEPLTVAEPSPDQV